MAPDGTDVLVGGDWNVPAADLAALTDDRSSVLAATAARFGPAPRCAGEPTWRRAGAPEDADGKE